MAAGAMPKQVALATYKNLVIKSREKKKFAAEIFYPVYFIGIMCFMHAMTPPLKLPAVASFAPQSLAATAPPGLAVLFAPNGTAEAAVLRRLQHAMPGLRSRGFASEAAMEAFNARPIPSLDAGALGGGTLSVGGRAVDRLSVVGLALRSLAKGEASYAIRLQHETARGLPGEAAGRVAPGDNTTVQGLLDSGFVALSHALNHALHAPEKEKAADEKEKGEHDATLVERFPFRGWEAKYRAEGPFAYLVPIYMPLAFLSSVAMLVVAIVEEKEKKLKEGMRMMGLSEPAYFASWVLTQLFISTLTVVVGTYIIQLGQLFPRSDIRLVFVLLVAYSVSMVPSCVIISIMFSKTKSAGQATNIFGLQILLALPMRLIDGHMALKTLLSVFSPVALGQALTRIIELEVEGAGLQWANLGSSNGHGAISAGRALLALVASTLGFSLLAVYLSFVLPGEYGLKRHPCFPCQRGLRRLQRLRRSIAPTDASSTAGLLRPSEASDTMPGPAAEAAVAEEVPAAAGAPRVVLAGLRKVYAGKKETVAVKGMHLSLYGPDPPGAVKRPCRLLSYVWDFCMGVHCS
jgi:hypothetical protein